MSWIRVILNGYGLNPSTHIKPTLGFLIFLEQQQSLISGGITCVYTHAHTYICSNPASLNPKPNLCKFNFSELKILTFKKSCVRIYIYKGEYGVRDLYEMKLQWFLRRGSEIMERERLMCMRRTGLSSPGREKQMKVPWY